MCVLCRKKQIYLREQEEKKVRDAAAAVRQKAKDARIEAWHEKEKKRRLELAEKGADEADSDEEPDFWVSAWPCRFGCFCSFFCGVTGYVFGADAGG